MSPHLNAPNLPPDLLAPSLQTLPRRPAARPFASEWIVFVAFFAGILPTAALFTVQAYRLGATRIGRELAIVGALAGLGVLGLAAAAVRLPIPDAITYRALALLYFLYARRRVRAAERAYSWLVSATRAKLLVPALVASVAGVALSAAALLAIGWVRR
jgi:hypothetical protein